MRLSCHSMTHGSESGAGAVVSLALNADLIVLPLPGRSNHLPENSRLEVGTLFKQDANRQSPGDRRVGLHPIAHLKILDEAAKCSQSRRTIRTGT